MTRPAPPFAPGDKVMQVENDYDKEVYNGDIGYSDDVNPDDGELTASFDGRTVSYGFGELDVLTPAYAATIHKSQVGISRRSDPGNDPALPDAATKSALHWRNARQETGRDRRAEESRRHRYPKRVRSAAMVEAAGMAEEKLIYRAAFTQIWESMSAFQVLRKRTAVWPR